MAISEKGVARGKVRFNFPDGTQEVHKLPLASKYKLGAKVNVLSVYPKNVPALKQHLIVTWFERVAGGWAIYNPPR
jgi:hypothetical protein